MKYAQRQRPTFAERYPVSFVVAFYDVIAVIVAGLLSYHYRFGTFDMAGRYNSATTITAVVAVTCLAAGGVYGSQRGVTLYRVLGALVLCWLTVAVILLALPFVLKVSDNYSRLWFGGMLCVAGSLSVVFRIAFYYLLRYVRGTGRNLKAVLLVGLGGSTCDQLRNPQALKEDGYKLVRELPIGVGDAWLNDLVESVNREGIHEVWLCIPLSQGACVEPIMYALRHHTVAVRFIPDWNDIRLLNHRVSYIGGVYSLDLSCSPMDGPARILKRFEDIIIGAFISLLILPVCVVIAIAIKLTSPGPVLFKQYRTGINGKRFKVYKFRSMVVHSEAGVTQAKRGDARVTRVGAFLRRSSLDELPQFYNVLQGRMSIVGPRPHALAHNEHYKELVESYMQRHKVKPGITGWAQVSGYRGETDTLEKMQKRVEFDLWYIDNWSLGLDLKIILLTVFKGFFNKNAF